jgi:hypothetical protein
MKELNEKTIMLAYARLLEFMDAGKDFKPWCESSDVDFDFIMPYADLQNDMEHSKSAAFLIGVALAWEVAKMPDIGDDVRNGA